MINENENISPRKGIHVFPDTNIFLHFAALDGLNWQSLCEADRIVKIHISQALLAELNKLKDTGATTTVRKRAASALKSLRDIHQQRRSAPNGTEVVFSISSPDVSRFPRLNPNVQDDHLLAEMLQFAAENPGDSIMLATDDGGFGLTVKAGHYEIKWVEPCGDTRLPAESNTPEIELQKLRKENERLRNAQPIPKIYFEDDEQIFFLPSSAVEWEAKLRESMDRVREKYPEMSIPKSSGNAYSISAISVFRTPEKVEKYNKQLSLFLQRMERSLTERLSAKARTIFFGLSAVNEGTAPAEDLRLHVHFPDGFTLRTNAEWNAFMKELPRPPEPPEPNLGALGAMAQNFCAVTTPRHSFKAPTSTISIRRTNSYDLDYRLIKLQQHEKANISKLALTFDSAPFEFQTEYRITADNLPQPILGKLVFAAPPDERRQERDQQNT